MRGGCFSESQFFQHQPLSYLKKISSRLFSVADPDPVRSGSGRMGPDPDPSLDKSYLSVIGMCKSHKYFQNLCFLTFWFIKKVSRRKLAENLFGSGYGSGRFQKSDPDPVKNLSDPQN
jgi:hypothetical protein